MRTEITQRIISGAVLGMAVLAVTWWHPLAFSVMCGVGGVILWREWRALTRHCSVWFIPGGILYISAAIASMISLRYHEDGLIAILRLFALVWAMDIGGYVVGKWIGKRKIAPRISPGKTWEGFAGSVLFVMLTSLSFHLPSVVRLSTREAFNPGALTTMMVVLLVSSVVLSLIFSALGLAGDLFESALKRRAGVKDSGTLIPGHGGLFDRVDALLPVAIFMGLMLGLPEIVVLLVGAAE